MRCKWNRRIFDAALLGELEGALAEHVGECAACRAVAERVERSGSVLREADAPVQAPADLWSRIEAEIDRPQVEVVPLRPARRWLLAASAAAALALAVGLWLVLEGRHEPRVVAGVTPEDRFYFDEHMNAERDYVFTGYVLSGEESNK